LISVNWIQARAGSDRPSMVSRTRCGMIRAFGTEWKAPSVVWFVGGTDPDTYAKAKESGSINDLPVNHSPLFAPVIHPTLQTGVETLVVAAQSWFSAQPTVDSSAGPP
jgi:hypothetical protein